METLKICKECLITYEGEKMKEKLTQERLKEALTYDPENGIFICILPYKQRYKKDDIAGHLTKEGYLCFPIDGATYAMHRLAFLYMEGYFPENYVDHIDRDKTNNKWNNLREVSASCNARNCSMAKNNKSGITGVCWNKKTNKWTAQISISKSVSCGYFDNLIDAVQARWNAEVKYGYPNCNTTSSAYLYLKKHGYI